MGGITPTVRTALGAAALLTLTLVIAACGSRSAVDISAGGEDGDSQNGDGSGTGSWSMQILGETSPDGGVAAASGNVGDGAGSTSVIVTTGPDGFAAWFDDGDVFQPATIEGGSGSASEAWSVAAVSAVPTGFLAAVNDYQNFQPQLWHSPDGVTWRALTTSGLEGPADVTSIAVNGDSVLLGGAGRGGTDPGSGPFLPLIWRSDDLESWTEADIAGAPDGAVTVLIGDGSADASLVAMGPSSDGPTTWRSTDSGLSWAIVPPADFGSGADFAELSAIASGGGLQVGIGILSSDTGEDLLLARSSDSGATWQRGDLSAAGRQGLQGGYSVAASGSGWWAISSRFVGAWEDPDACYVDLDECEGGSAPVLLYSSDAQTWEAVDLQPLDLPEYANFDRVVDRGDAVSIVAGSEQLTVWTFSSEGPPALLAPPSERPELDIALVTWDAELEIGETYRFPLYIHCGMDYLANFNGSHWYLNAAPAGTVETGAGQSPKPEWPVAQQSIFGFVTLTDADTIEYSIDQTTGTGASPGGGEVIAVYKTSDEEPAGCD